jgi:hypothetical protein
MVSTHPSVARRRAADENSMEECRRQLVNGFCAFSSAAKIPFADTEASTERDCGGQKLANRRNFHCVPMATFGRTKLANY